MLAVVSRGADLRQARERGYRGMEHITLDGSHYRTDIALAASEGRIETPVTPAA